MVGPKALKGVIIDVGKTPVNPSDSAYGFDVQNTACSTVFAIIYFDGADINRKAFRKFDFATDWLSERGVDEIHSLSLSDLSRVSVVGVMKKYDPRFNPYWKLEVFGWLKEDHYLSELVPHYLFMTEYERSNMGEVELDLKYWKDLGVELSFTLTENRTFIQKTMTSDRTDSGLTDFAYKALGVVGIIVLIFVLV